AISPRATSPAQCLPRLEETPAVSRSGRCARVAGLRKAREGLLNKWKRFLAIIANPASGRVNAAASMALEPLSYHWPAMTNIGPFYLIQPIHYHVHTAKTGRFAHFEAESPELPISRISWEYRNSTGHDRWGRIDVAVGA